MLNDQNIRSTIIVALYLLLAVFATDVARAQNVAVKTNVLYLATATPNLGVEMSTGKKHTAQLYYGLNPWDVSSEKSLKHWVLMPEYRHWFCQSFNGWFVGVHLMGGQFNAGGYKLPFGIFPNFENNHYEGWYVGGGVTAGYQLPLSRHWNAEASVGVGYDYISYDKYRCGTCGESLGSSHTNYIGPTKAVLSLLYIF